MQSTEEEVNTIALQKYQEHLGQLKADTLDLEQEQNLPSLLQYLTDHKVDYLNHNIESLLVAIETYRQTIGNSDYLSDQIQSFLNHLEVEQGETYALRVSKELLALMARPDVI